MADEYHAMISRFSHEELRARCNTLFSEIETTKKHLERVGDEALLLTQHMVWKFGSTVELDSLHNIAYKIVLGEIKCKDKEVFKIKQRCKWWNRGYCREGERCLYDHSVGDCEEHYLNGVCNSQACHLRHRRACKYWKSDKGCFRGNVCEYLHSKLDNFENSEDILQEEVKLLKLEIEKLRVENESKEYRLRNLDNDYEHDSDITDEENKEYNNEDDGNMEDIFRNNMQEYLKNGLEDEDLNEWFQTEIVEGETLFVCNLCDHGFEEIDKLKKHMICRHKESIVTLSSNAIREL